MKIAIVHDWLTGMRGGEKCLEVFCELFPQATIFTLLHNKGSVSRIIESMKIKTSFMQHLPKANMHYRNYLPLFPRAVESFDLKEFDFVLSSSHCVAKGARKPPQAKHLCYCYTPMRYAWFFFEQYFGSYPSWKKKIVQATTEYLKKWDLATLNRVDEFMAISETVKERIHTIYNRGAEVIYPPVDIENFQADSRSAQDFYLCVSSLVPYKRIDVIIEAFNQMPDKKLIIVGDGHLRKDLEQRKISKNINLLGWLPQKDLVSLYRQACCFVYAAEEDFGIAPVEAQASGVPVVAYGKGGVTETVVALNATAAKQHPTGLFFDKQTSSSLIAAIELFEKMKQEFSSETIRQHALQFSRQHFKERIQEYIHQKIGSYCYVN
ncbi:MAG: glycosyltransferase [Candidatus Omnitrophota bacterium]